MVLTRKHSGQCHYGLLTIIVFYGKEMMNCQYSYKPGCSELLNLKYISIFLLDHAYYLQNYILILDNTVISTDLFKATHFLTLTIATCPMLYQTSANESVEAKDRALCKQLRAISNC